MKMTLVDLHHVELPPPPKSKLNITKKIFFLKMG